MSQSELIAFNYRQIFESLREESVAHIPDSVVAVFWFASTALLAASGWVIAGRYFPRDAVLNRVGHTIVIGWSQIVVVGVALGALGSLLPTALLVGVTSLAALTLILIKQKGVRPEKCEFDAISGPPDQTLQTTERLWLVAWLVLIAFWVGHSVTSGLLRFPTDWDTLMYHLPMVDHWLQAKSLYAPDCLRWSDPGNNELVTLWLVAPFSGDFLYSLTNLPSTVLLACVSVEFGRHLGLPIAWRNITAMAVVTNFVVFKQLTDTENDVAVAALLLASLTFALRYSDRRVTADLILGVICLGLLAGVKYYALGYVTVAALTAALSIARRQGGRAAAKAAILGLLSVLMFSGYWYARNWVNGGSPLHPLGSFTQKDELAEVYPGGIWSTTFIGNGRPELPELAFDAVWGMTGPCHLLACLLLPISLIWLTVRGCSLATRSPGSEGEGVARLALAYATVLSGLVLLVTPFAVEDVPGTLNQMHWKYCPVRYGLCFLSLSVLTFTVLLHDVSQGAFLHLGCFRKRCVFVRTLTSLPLFGLVVGTSFQLIRLKNNDLDVVFGESILLATDIVLVAAISSLVCVSWPRIRFVFALLMILSAVVGVAQAGDWLAQRWHLGFESHYDRMLAGGLFRHLKDTQPAGIRICVLDLRPYPFFGSSRQFQVCQPYQVRSPQELTDYLRDREVILVAARFDMNLTVRGWQNCRGWLTEHDRQFLVVRGRPWPYTVYQVAPSDGQ